MDSCKNLSILRETMHDDNMIEQCASSEFMGRYIVDKGSCLDEGYNWTDFVPNYAGQRNEWEGFPANQVFLPNQGSEMNQKIETRKVTLCLKRKTDSQESQVSLDSVFRVVTRKRSHFFRPARSSPWGKCSGISKAYRRSNEFVSNAACCADLLKSHSPDTQNNNLIQGNAQVLGEKDHAPKRYIRLKIKFGKSGDKPLFAKLSNNKDLSDTKHDGNGLEFGAFSKKSAGDAIDDNMIISSNEAVEACSDANESIGVYTSPDSDVINSVPNESVSGIHLEHLDSTILSSDAAVLNGKGRKNKVEKKIRPKNCPSTLKMEINVCPSEIHSSTTSREALSNLSCEKEDICKPSKLPEENELIELGETLKVENCLEDGSYCSWGSDPVSAESLNSEIMPATQSRGLEISESQKFSRATKEYSRFSGHDKSTRGKKPGYKQTRQGSSNQRGREVGFCDQYAGRTKTQRETVEELSFLDSAWVQCDDCDKWRRVPDALALSIEGNCRWICTDNSDKSFGDCSIPQELSNEEISLELGISSVKADAYKKVGLGPESRQKTGCRKPPFRGIKCNQYLHRTRKSQNIDEIMVCQCNPPPNGRLGCGDECINRMLNIECVHGACPCGNLCSNQQFQRRKYAKLELFKAGKKGYGLRVLENLREGQFIIEYVGEVLDTQAYEARLKDYAAKGQQHFYLMTLNGNEVIDADAKGNLGRFINHSCDPNCRTQKWMVNGEICIGIFALREIKKEEELTFDYNYVRLFGAAVKKCYCGSSLCQGFMGGDLLTGDVVIQSDSDEECNSDDECDPDEDCFKHGRLEEEEEEVIRGKIAKPVSSDSPVGDLKDQLAGNLLKVSAPVSNVSVGLVDDFLIGDVVVQSDSGEEPESDEECFKPLRTEEEAVIRDKMENPVSRNSPIGDLDDQIAGNRAKLSETASSVSMTVGLVDEFLTEDVVIQSDSDEECESDEEYVKPLRPEEEEVIRDKMKNPVFRNSPGGDLNDQIVVNLTKVSETASKASTTVGLVDGLLTPGVVIQSDSDEECCKPLRPEEEEGIRDKMENSVSRNSPVGDSDDQIVGNLMKVSETASNLSTTIDLVDDITEVEDSKCYSDSSILKSDSSECKNFSPVRPVKVILSPKAVTSKTIATCQQNINEEIEMPSLLSICHVQTSDASSVEVKKQSLDAGEKISPALRLPMEHFGSCVSAKKGKGIRSSPDIKNLPKIMAAKSLPSTGPERITEGRSNGQTESVEAKLNELLNSEGGISKHKDATKGYLKLLLLTAASRVNVSSETIQRNRNLSMILDALLKTRSRVVLKDIINKNGLQMLHNMIKQYKEDFKKIPILRKILKVLEYLASRDILGIEHIVRVPPCQGMESFRDSLLILTEHDDKQVHQIARNFRDKWIPWPFRRPSHTVRNENMIKSVTHLNSSGVSLRHHHSPDQTESLHRPLDSEMKSKHSFEPEPRMPLSNATITRKRKSRWDQPGEITDSQSLPHTNQEIEPRQYRGVCSVSGNRDIGENVSSGFRPNTLPDMVLARPQEKFVSSLPVSYGVPLEIVQKLGFPATEMPDLNWAVAPGIPFQPFPPLPPYPRKNETLSASSSDNCTMINNNHDRKDPGPRRSSGVCVTKMPCLNTRQGYKRRRVSLPEAGRTDYRRQKLNVPSWLRNRCERW